MSSEGTFNCIYVDVKAHPDKWVKEHAAEVEHAIGEALKKLGWKEFIWISIPDEPLQRAEQ